MSKPYNYHSHNKPVLDLDVESWGGEYVQLHYVRDGVAIILLLHEIDPLIEALQEAKVAQSKPDQQREEALKMVEWNQAALRSFKPDKGLNNE